MVDRTDLGSVGASHESSSLSPPTVRRALPAISGIRDVLLAEYLELISNFITIVVSSVYRVARAQCLRSYFITPALEEK